MSFFRKLLGNNQKLLPDKIPRRTKLTVRTEKNKSTVLLILLHFDRAMQYSGTISARMAIPMTKHGTPLAL